ncbi:pentatricopeptide repeat-containing protein At2g20710, mitochondrial-like [Magnolia sinica]|uniref:pentatricopeptide repeat-containing protein At2g20710, mitochondrial-like n=1 Tax=Magnolia sinica TaxID=86752 RepID=UPI002658BEAD|nr:pentatricopeptide repeat-containing protein At2g20710, mitochondrial-like [Magnolia sinica]
MNLRHPSRISSFLKCCLRVRVFSSAQALTSPSPPPPRTRGDSLYHRISPLGDPTVSLVPVLEGWIKEGKTVKRWELEGMIKQLRKYRRFKHALEVSQWMTDRRYFELSQSTVAIRLDLISKVHGLEHAEKYFNNIPIKLKSTETYGTLLNCYVQRKFVEKAEALFQKMKDLGLVNSLSYNTLMNLYLQTERYEKFDNVVKEMDRNSIRRDVFTFSIQMTRLVATADIDGMEAALRKMEDDPLIAPNWDVYLIVADGYKKAGLPDKALEMLKRSEALVTRDQRRIAYDFLLTMYAGIGRKDEMYRLWNLQKSSSKKVSNASYISMIVSLAKLDDIEGAEKIIAEWESVCFCYDFRVPNRLIVAYCKKGLFVKAESFINKAIQEGKTPYPSTWECLATGYLEDNQIPRGVEMMKKAMSVKRHGWKPNSDNVASCLEYFKGQGDVEGAEEFVRLLRPWVPPTRDVYHRLLRTYVIAGKSVSDVLDRMKEDGLDADEELHEILKTGQDS